MFNHVKNSVFGWRAKCPRQSVPSIIPHPRPLPLQPPAEENSRSSTEYYGQPARIMVIDLDVGAHITLIGTRVCWAYHNCYNIIRGGTSGGTHSRSYCIPTLHINMYTRKCVCACVYVSACACVGRPSPFVRTQTICTRQHYIILLYGKL